MTIYTQFELRCDGLPGPFDCEPAIYENRLDQALDTARRQGWIQKNGKHLCPDHQDGGDRD